MIFMSLYLSTESNKFIENEVPILKYMSNLILNDTLPIVLTFLLRHPEPTIHSHPSCSSHFGCFVFL